MTCISTDFFAGKEIYISLCKCEIWKRKNNDGRDRLKSHISPLRVFIFEEQTTENDENVGYLFLSRLQNFVIGNCEERNRKQSENL
jgi:hypothetical protein